MEGKLADYRARREREAYFNRGKEKIKSILSLPSLKKQQQPSEEEMYAQIEEQEKLINEADTTDDHGEIDDTKVEDDVECCTPAVIVCYSLSFVVWIVLYAVFISFQFGTVYLIVSALIFICVNTSTRRRKPNEVSAYSVFNKDCKSIDGTLKAEQLEREIRFGRGVIHV